MAENQYPTEGMNINAISGFDRFEDVYFDSQPTEVIDFVNRGNTFIFQTTNQFTLTVEVVDDFIIRFKYGLVTDKSKNVSYVLQSPAQHQAKPEVSFEEGLGDFLIRTTHLYCLINKADLKVKILDRNNNNAVINEDILPYKVRRTILQGTEWIKIQKKAHPGESYYGLGDKSGPLNLRGQQLENWNTDAFGYEADTDPLYRSIPFYFGLHRDTAYGIFLHNTYRSHFDFDTQFDGVLSFSVEGGQMDYFFIYGPELTTVAQRYIQLTGKPELPPLWALGFHQCRWSYFPESRVREIATEFRTRQIPCDAIYLDIDYMDGFRCFTWNKDYFPNPTQMIRDLEQDGFQTVVMIDPGIKVDPDYWVYKDGMNNDVFCRRTNGELMIGPVWPDNCVFPDFTDPNVRSWWKNLYTSLYLEHGVSGFWNDMNEPAVFKVNRLTFPDEVLHHHEGYLANHAEIHNVYGLQMSRSTYEGLKMLKPHKRPFLLTRATFSGGQRYAAIWTGDNIASWEHLRLANIQCQRTSISGFSFIGTDIGGFAEEPDGELFVRWLQLGAFHPLYRVHSMGNHAGGAEMVDVEAVRASEQSNRLDQEPWSFGEPYTALARKAIELRYQLLGYIYSAFRKYTLDGTPVLKSLVFYDQHDPKTVNRENEFLCGADILVNPVIEAESTSQITYLPKGDWYEYWTNHKYRGKQTIRTAAELDKIPMFVRAGSILPIYPIRQHVNAPIEAIVLNVYFAETGMSELYEDQGEGYAYQQGNYKLRVFELKGTSNSLTLLQRTSGNYQETYKSITIHLIGLPFIANQVTIDQEVGPLSLDSNNQTFVVKSDFQSIHIK